MPRMGWVGEWEDWWVLFEVQTQCDIRQVGVHPDRSQEQLQAT